MNRRQVMCAAVAICAAIISGSARAADNPEIWKDPSQAPEARAHDLVGRMTLEEKASQMLANPPAIPRLGIPAYSHRNECLHGVSNGVATVFPQAIGMAATFDTALIKQEADAIATEGRAKHNDYVAKHNGDTGEHNGLNFYSPNINIFRDPRWGRGQETYGEDPYLTSQMGLAFIEGLRGDDPAHPKAIGCAKHFAVHSGPESERHHFNAKPSDADLYNTYLPAFEALVREGKVGSVMGAYSAIDGTPCCANPWLLTDLLRKQWGFDGVVFSDGGAIGDIWAEHKFVPGPIEASAAAIKAGCDVSSGGMGAKPDLTVGPGHNNNGIKGGWAFVAAPDAVKKGLLDEAAVTQACERELTMRMKLGLFDPADKATYSKIGVDQIDSAEHRALALKVAQESIVLLKNDDLLPVAKAKYKKIAVIGPNADAAPMQNGNYAGRASRTTTILQGIKDAAGKDVEVAYEQGSRRTGRKDGSDPEPPEMAQKAITLAKSSDLIIFVSGIDAGLEREEASPRDDNFEGFQRGDRIAIELPRIQETLIHALADTGKPMALVNCSGSAMAMPWENEHVPAIVQAWYPGEEGGRAVAQALFGEINPAGRLPVTFYASTKDLPPFEDYSMANRTYRYFGGKPLYAFGYGLSYTKFEYADAKVDHDSIGADDTLKLTFTVKNTGERDGEDVPQVYFRQPKSSPSQAKLALCGFSRVKIAKGGSTQVTIEIPAQRFRTWDTKQKKYVVASGEYELLIGGASDQAQLHANVTVQ